MAGKGGLNRVGSGGSYVISDPVMEWSRHFWISLEISVNCALKRHWSLMLLDYRNGALHVTGISTWMIQPHDKNVKIHNELILSVVTVLY